MKSQEKDQDYWYKLDNAGKLFPSIATDRQTTVFRMSATLYEQIDEDILQVALKHLMLRMPYYRVTLKRGFFWYYFEKTELFPQVEEEKYFPCMYFPFRQKDMFPFRVLYFGNRISVEMTHCLSDGTGALYLLKSLVAEYLKLKKGIQPETQEGLLIPGHEVNEGEYEDSFKKYYRKKELSIPPVELALHLPLPLCERGQYHAVTGVMDADSVKKKAKQMGGTITAFLLAVYFETVLDFIKETPPHIRQGLTKPITMNVPVNLRSVFPSITMRNFFLSIIPKIVPGEKDNSFENIIAKVGGQMKDQLIKENLENFISRNVQGETSIFVRSLPLVLKDVLLPLGYILFGENLYTSSISNVGRLTMPSPLEDHIERFDFFPSPSRNNKLKAAAITFKGKLYFTFGKLTRATVIEKIFFRKLVRMGIKVKIETNSPRATGR